jgi:hypothetical protein
MVVPFRIALINAEAEQVISCRILEAHFPAADL